jgi:hypothetical protein
LNTLTRNAMFLILLGCSVLLLPACGSKGHVNSQKPPETVLNPEGNPVSNGKEDIGMPGGKTPIRTYVEKIHRSKGPKSTTITTTPVTENTSAPPPVVTQAPAQTPAMETPVPVKKSGGVHWFLWLLVLLVLGGIGWYFWSKSQSDHQSPSQPMPPVGGLSPVSGFTAVKDRIEDEVDSKPSFWSKKLF